MDHRRLEFWRTFLVEQSGYPAPKYLARKLAAASVTEFCDCACNSFGVYVPQEAGVAPICDPMPHSAVIFQRSFFLSPSRKSLELVIHADKLGNLFYINVDCSTNSVPVPERIALAGPAYHIHASPGLAPNNSFKPKPLHGST